jgi:hypothetical protein
MLANTFLEGNRAVAKIDEKRIKLGNDISNALTQLSMITNQVSSSMKEGFESLAKQTQEAAAKGTEMMANTKSSVPTVPTMPPTGGFHRRTRRKTWRTKKTRTTRVLTTRRTSEKH